ncbi:MAG: efflux RND transporter periplasmic adaptor subunit [Holophaga sp.]|nr:efflux RND transporter periplasmic adaptor subunit [Holophaga sp.]
MVTIQASPLRLTTRLPGRIAAFLTAEIRPQVNGIIQSRRFEEGSTVRAGQVLYQINPATYQAAVDQAKANLAAAEADLANVQATLPTLQARADRHKSLLAIHAVGQQDFEQAQTDLQQAQATARSRQATILADRASMESARINLGFTPIQAPISGRVGKSTVTVGALVSSYQSAPLTTIQQIDPVYVDVVQANADLLRLRTSLDSGRLRSDAARQRKVQLLLEDGSSYPLAGTLKFRDFTVDPGTGAVTVRLTFANPKETLLPGTFVQAVVEEGIDPKAILVPQQAVNRDPKGQAYVWLVGKDGRAENRLLTVDRTVGDQWLVTTGLTGGEQVVVEGGERLRVGMAVRTTPFQKVLPRGSHALVGRFAGPEAGKAAAHV